MGNQHEGLEVWGGIECTLNRVRDEYYDQLGFSGHYDRDDDLDRIASLGIRTLRYPVLWEKHVTGSETPIDWSFSTKRLARLKELGITPIVGLVHHGSGPAHVNFYDGSFEKGLATYARMVAEQFPWVNYYTPVNEPLTTARFCGLYGHWYPHRSSTYDFLKILLSECKATVMAMHEIRKINPEARLIQTDDLARCHATPLLQYQAAFENERRWVSYELICGRLTRDKLMWKYMVKHGIKESELQYFLDNPCPPYICGFNYYKTSERYLDENVSNYPQEFHGGNAIHAYADVHTCMVSPDLASGPYQLLKEAWQRLGLPLAITECHLYEPRDEQIRWISSIWNALTRLRSEHVPVKAITGWALFGSYGWNNLVTEPNGTYEPGVFNLCSGEPRKTAVAEYLQSLATNPAYRHPVLQDQQLEGDPESRPILIIGKQGLLATAFRKVFEARRIRHVTAGHDELDITDYSQICEYISALRPWAVINTAGNIDIDGGEINREELLKINFLGAAWLAEACKLYCARYLSFSTDMVFDGKKDNPYVESDTVSPLNIYGLSKVLAERSISQVYPQAIIVRTSSFFSPWGCRDFVSHTLESLREQRMMEVAEDLRISPTYLPDLVLECLNLLLDNENGVFHIVNEGSVTWAEFAEEIARVAGIGTDSMKPMPDKHLGRNAIRPKYTVMTSERGIRLPKLEDALRRYFEEAEQPFIIERMAV